MLLDQLQEAGAVESQHFAVSVRADGRGAREIGEQGHLPEWRAGPKRAHPGIGEPALSRHVDPEGATGHEVEGVSRIALAEHDGSARQGHRVEMRGELGERDAVHSREEIDPAEQLGMLRADCPAHRPPSPAGARVGSGTLSGAARPNGFTDRDIRARPLRGQYTNARATLDPGVFERRRRV